LPLVAGADGWARTDNDGSERQHCSLLTPVDPI
jgi:hypothetical protein